MTTKNITMQEKNMQQVSIQQKIIKTLVMVGVYGFLLLMALCFAISRRKSRKVLGVMKKAMPALLGLGAMVLWYTMIGNGMQDYLKVVPVSLFWCMLPLLELGRLVEENVENGEE